MPWLGRNKIAFVPLHRPNAHPPDDPIPADWPAEILRRVYYDPNAFPGLPDRSLRTYIHRVSSGLADLDATVLPMEVLDQQDVPPDALESKLGASLRAQGFAAAALVMLGQPPTGQGQRGGFWARFDMSETLGTWAMELMHCLTGMDDLYTFGGNMQEYDNMAGAGGTHPSAWTKRAVQWLDSAAVAQHMGRTIEYDLHAVSLSQPPPHDRVSGVQIGSVVPYLMVEARKMADQFDGIIPKEGVIVYRVQTTDPLGHTQDQLAPLALLTLDMSRTRSALAVGKSLTTDTGVVVQVTSALPGGYRVSINNPLAGNWGDGWSSVAEGRSMPGAPVTAVALADGRFALFLADPNGGIYTASGNAALGWGDGWSSVAEGRSMPGAPVTAVALADGRFALFLADPNGGIYTASGNAALGWGDGWSSVAEGRSMPGAPVTAVALADGRFALFLADPNGGIYTASGNAALGWGDGWSSVAEGRSMPGAPVTAVALADGRFALFLADPNGGIYTASGNAALGWGDGWSSVAEGRSMPGAPVTAVALADGRFALFLADPNGGIYTASGNAALGWGDGWSSVAEGRSMPGAPVTAVALADGRFALFLADPNGGIYTASGNAALGWGDGWSSVAEGRSMPGAPVTAVAFADGRFALFLADPNGGIYTASGNAG